MGQQQPVAEEYDEIVVRGEPDVYGQTHPIESVELIQSKLEEFENELQKLPNDQLVALRMAEETCPELLSNEFKLIFLRCDVFQPQLSAPRFAKYWKKRLEILGDDNAFRPLTLKNPAFQGEEMNAWFATAQVQLIRRADHHRDYLYVDAAKADPTLYSRECALKGILYVLHALLEDEEVQKRGLIAISNSDGVSQRNRDTLLTKALIELSQGAFPIRLSAVHCCNLPTIFNVIMRFFLALIGERLRKRIIVHCEVGMELLTKLVDKYGFQLEDIPTQMGGERKADFGKWIEERSQQCL